MAKLGETIGEVVSKVETKRSSDNVWNNWRLMLLGPSNEGKTVVAAECLPDGNLPQEFTVLDDMIWMLFDNDGLSGLKRLNIDVDYHDMTDIPPDRIVNATEQRLKLCREQLKSGEKRTLVFDTGTSFSKAILSAVSGLGMEEGPKYWGKVGEYQRRIFDLVKAMPGNVIFIAHVKAVAIYATEGSRQHDSAKATLRGKGLKEGDLRLDIDGSMSDYYVNNFAEIWAVKATGNLPNREFYIYPNGIGGIKTKTKQNCFEKKEPANLQYLFKKIKGEV
jgi:hypothetical protein